MPVVALTRNVARRVGGSCLLREEDSTLQTESVSDPVTVLTSSSDTMPKRVDNKSRAPTSVGESDAHAIVDDYVSKFSGIPGAKVKPFPSLVAANEPSPESDPTLLTWPASRMLMRSPGGNWAFEGGFVGSLQLCYDLCSAELSVIGWIWAGGGVETKGLLGGKSWWGGYVFAEKEFGKWHLDFMPTLNCGTCDAACKGPDDGSTEWGGGIAGFPIALKPGERKSLRQAGIEVGALLTPHSRCDADLELICLIDLTKYLGPVGAAVSSAEELLNKWASKLGVEIECGVGVDISGTVHLCRGAPGSAFITSNSAKICGVGYVGCGIGLAHDKSALPGI